MRLTGLDVAAFTRDYWQKQPLLLRRAWDGWVNPLHANDLAGLACDEGVEARLVMHAPNGWTVEHGPIPEGRFATLGPEPWTLLVNAVDHYVPEVAALRGPFRFIPDWRVDDIMVSYATDGGGVGPHFDQYDVFLIQGSGRRRWQIGRVCDGATALLPHDELRLIADFEPEEDWILEEGDILYLPPGVAHNGTAIGDDCMTYSVGFRAPARTELIAHWCDHVLAVMQEDDRYRDPPPGAQDNPGEITPDAIGRLHAMALAQLQDRAAFARWYGEYNSVPKYPDVDWSPSVPLTRDDVVAALAAGVGLCRNPASRFSFIRGEAGAVLLFVDGASFACAGAAADLAEEICRTNGASLEVSPGPTAAESELIVALCKQGSLALDVEGDRAD